MNTRPVDRGWVARKLREGFDVKRLGVPTVSSRADGTFNWIDGQNRGALCRAASRADIKITMKVFHGLSVEEEAELFLGLNDNRRVQPIYKFIAEVTAGRPEALAISRIANDAGWNISDGSTTNSIHAVAALITLFRADSQKSGTILRDVLSIVTEAWGHTPEAVSANILLGLGSMLNASPSVDQKVLVKKLSSHAGGAGGLVGKGRGLREATGCKVSEGVDQVIRGVYNSGKRGGRLSTWAVPASRPEAVQESILA
ncbi:DUF6551 family protein [Streptomyces sp. c-19]|uniref:DUF6551 family protein n=1 Tax=Streptomyces sp. c-19 TaxID=2789275 RepID=UPI0039802A25